MAETDANCSSYFDNCDEKTRNLSAIQIFRKLITKNSLGCAALRIVANISGTFSASSIVRTSTRTFNSTPGSYTIPSGNKNAYIETSSDFVGTILGVNADPSRVYAWDRNQNDDYNDVIAYVITSGSVIIGKTV